MPLHAANCNFRGDDEVEWTMHPSPDALAKAERPPPARLVKAYAGVTAVTLAAVLAGYGLIARSLDAQAAAEFNSDAARVRLSSANDVLGYAVRLETVPRDAMTGQFSAALSQSIGNWQRADAAGSTADAVMRLNPGDRIRLTDLQSETRLSYQDMLSAAGGLLSSVAPTAGSGAPLETNVNGLAAKESAYADAVKAEGEFFGSLQERAATDARIEAALFGLLLLGIFGCGAAFVIVPAHRRAAQSMETAIRSHEQEARIGSEVARHAAERDRQQAEEQFQALFRHSSIGVALTDSRGWILDTNDALQSMLGFTAEELRGSQFGEWAIDVPTAANQTGRRERLYRRKDGTTLWVDETSTAAPGSGEALLATIWMVQDIEKRKNAERQLEYDATHDGLTGLRNRGYFDEIIERAVRNAQRSEHRTFTVLMIDLDRFKYVNDTRGHAAGDAVLAEVGRRLQLWATDNNVVARYGGDEFAAFIPDVADPTVAIEVAAHLQRLLDAPLSVHGMTTRLTASIGVCPWSREFSNCDSIMRAADSAAYRAKELGRSRVVLYDSGMAEHDDLRRRVGVALRTAVENDELSLVYQPIVTLPERTCIGFESLVRWSHPELGPISPSVFISVAEEVGLMTRIGAWVLDRACRQLAAWHSQPEAKLIKLHVNVSPQQTAEPTFAKTVLTALERSGLQPSDIVLELTETAMLDSRGSNDTIAQLREMGLSFVLDDFGTGYSSLSYLQLLPMDALKIDQSFIRGPYESLAAPAIVHALITLSRTLGISAVAEGVESEKQASLLVHMGCRFAQGYLFSEPLEADDALEFLLRDGLREALG